MTLRKAKRSDVPIIWKILQEAIERRRLEGSQQWQNGYPNPNSIQNDLEKGYAHVLEINEAIQAYVALIFDVDPAYEALQGKWLSNEKYLCIHRLAVSNSVIKKGVATRMFLLIEKIALKNSYYSIKLDTNFDNLPMLKIFKNLGYTYCGEVMIMGAPRMAYEKLLKKD